MENAVGKSLMAPLGTGRISFINRKLRQLKRQLISQRFTKEKLKNT